MLPEELVALAKKVQRSQAEGPGLEVKTAHEDCPKLYDTLSSFSNQAGGGTILFGLSEKENFAVIKGCTVSAKKRYRAVYRSDAAAHSNGLYYGGNRWKDGLRC